LQAETANLKNLINAGPKLKQTPMPWLVIAIEVLGLAVLLLTQVLTIQALRGISVKSKKPETAEDSRHDYSELAPALSSRLSDTLSVEGLSQAEWARRNGVSTKSISILINHQKRSDAGKECISKNELSEIQSALN
jgi:cytoskeletal protein RodZ